MRPEVSPGPALEDARARRLHSVLIARERLTCLGTSGTVVGIRWLSVARPWPEERAGEAGRWRSYVQRPFSGNLVKRRKRWAVAGGGCGRDRGLIS